MYFPPFFPMKGAMVDIAAKGEDTMNLSNPDGNCPIMLLFQRALFN